MLNLSFRERYVVFFPEWTGKKMKLTSLLCGIPEAQNAVSGKLIS